MALFAKILWCGLIALNLLAAAAAWRTSPWCSGGFGLAALLLALGLWQSSTLALSLGTGFALLTPLAYGIFVDHRVEGVHHLVRTGLFVLTWGLWLLSR